MPKTVVRTRLKTALARLEALVLLCSSWTIHLADLAPSMPGCLQCAQHFRQLRALSIKALPKKPLFVPLYCWLCRVTVRALAPQLAFLLSFHGPEYMMFLGSNAANSSSNDKVPEEAGRRSEIRAVMLVAFVKSDIGFVSSRRLEPFSQLRR